MRHILVLCILFSSLVCQTQTIEEFFADKAGTVTWLGIDYSHVRLKGEFTQFKDTGPSEPVEIRDKYFPGWNVLVLNESSKYDFKGMFMLSALVPDISMITAVNAAADAGKMKEEPKTALGCNEVKGIIQNYDTRDKEGLGIVLIADVLDKTAGVAGYFVVVFNMKSKEVLLCEKVSEKASGIGMRNYWAGSLYNLVKDGKKNLYWTWKGKYVK